MLGHSWLHLAFSAGVLCLCSMAVAHHSRALSGAAAMSYAVMVCLHGRLEVPSAHDAPQEVVAVLLHAAQGHVAGCRDTQWCAPALRPAACAPCLRIRHARGRLVRIAARLQARFRQVFVSTCKNFEETSKSTTVASMPLMKSEPLSTSRVRRSRIPL